MTPPFKTKEFLDLQKVWDKKLEKSGFQDIEQRADGNLKMWHSHFFRSRYNSILFKAKEDYYRAAGQFLYDHIFDNPIEKLIWELHANALSIRNIVGTLKKKNKKPSSPGKVNEIIQKLQKLMVEKCRNQI